MTRSRLRASVDVARKRFAFERRTFLKGALGGLVALPLLHSLGVRAQTEAPIKRLILMFNPNGTIEDAFWPTGGETDFVLSEMLAPLEPFRERLLLLKGVDTAVAGVGPGGPHQKGVGGLFTGSDLQEGDFVDGDGKRSGWANGQSIDQRYVEHLGIVTPIGSLELGVRATQAEVRSRISYRGPGDPMPPQNDPMDVWARLFGGFAGDPDSRLVQLDKRRSVLDSVQSQFNQINSRVSAEDRHKLEAHQALVRDLEKRLQLGSQSGTGGAAGSSGSGVGECLKPPAPTGLAPDDEHQMPDVAEAQLELLALALSCDLTRVASVQFSTAINDIRYPWLNSMGSGHALSHAGPSDADARAELILRGKWLSEQLAYLMALLDNIPEGDGSVLDNTLIVWGNELASGNTHTHAGIPWVLAGGAAGYFKMGRFLDFGGVPHNALLVSILQAMGVPVERFGHAEFDSGPLVGLEA